MPSSPCFRHAGPSRSRTQSPPVSAVVLLVFLTIMGLATIVESAAAAASVNTASPPNKRNCKQRISKYNLNTRTPVGFRWWMRRVESNQTQTDVQQKFVDVRQLVTRRRHRRSVNENRREEVDKRKDSEIALVSTSFQKKYQTVLIKVAPAAMKEIHNHLQAMSSSLLDEDWKRRLEEHRDQFMDRVALISSWLLWKQEETKEESKKDGVVNPNAITSQSDLASFPPRSIHIVTTAALPWYTGTAINPLLRAAYLYRSMVERQQQLEKESDFRGISSGHKVSVTLVVPWLERPEDQDHLYYRRFSEPSEQEEFIRTWLREEAGLPDEADGLKILFYPARYHKGLRSIFAMGDMIEDVILKHNTTALDVCVLEEPEHCNWFRAPGDGWTQQFHYVVGIIHTNYKEYAATSHYSGLWTAPALAMICSAMVRAYCHKVIKLSDTLQTFSPGKEVTCNVHGVREEFWKQGLKLANELKQHDLSHGEDGSLLVEPRVYFLGKLLWAKGLDIMLEYQEYYNRCTGTYFKVDVYGSGPDSDEIQRAFAKKPAFSKIVTTAFSSPSTAVPFITSSSIFLSSLGNNLQFLAKQQWSNLRNSIFSQVGMPNTLPLPLALRRPQQGPIPARFLGRVDHAHLPHDYTVFVNPSVSEVLCTATAEALAMGKFAVIPYHPSNHWFLQFPNCLPYRNKLEFVANMRWALSHNPKPLTEDQAKEFSWQAATERLYQAAAMTHREAALAMDITFKLEGERIAWLHNEVLGKGSRGDVIRKVLGAGPVSEQVRYQKETAQKISLADGAIGATGISEDEENEGLGQGFSQSWFATALRSVWNDISKFAVS